MVKGITPLRVLLFGWFLSAEGVVSHAGVVTFLNDYEGFLAAAGDVRTIDFETLPDGSPSHVGMHITPDFNYTSQGVTFSSPTGAPFISGNPVSGFGLMADAYFEQQRTWIIATLTQGALAVGFFGPGTEFLSVYGGDGTLLDEAVVPGNVVDWFVGFVSDVPIARAVGDLGGTGAAIQAFAFTPVPEPMTVFLLLIGAFAAVRRRPNK